MNSQDVIDFHRAAKSRGLRFWVDGGWAVDALLGRQTRPHGDLDIAVDKSTEPGLVALLVGRGFHETDRETEWNYVMVDPPGRRIDFHVFIFDEKREVAGGLLYPTDSLTGKGVIDGVEVDCIPPGHLVKFHTGYELREKDFKDVSALCAKFKLQIPREYDGFGV